MSHAYDTTFDMMERVKFLAFLRQLNKAFVLCHAGRRRQSSGRTGVTHRQGNPFRVEGFQTSVAARPTTDHCLRATQPLLWSFSEGGRRR